VIGEETLSSTSDFNRRHSAARSAKTKSVIQVLLMGNIVAMWTLAPCPEHIKRKVFSFPPGWTVGNCVRTSQWWSPSKTWMSVAFN
jgi:hypothetical protein